MLLNCRFPNKNIQWMDLYLKIYSFGEFRISLPLLVVLSRDLQDFAFDV